MVRAPAVREEWPELPLDEWEDTYATLHRYTQIIGKIRLALSPMVNHFWNVAFYLTDRGMTTSPMPYRDRFLEFEFDFIDHNLALRTNEGRTAYLALVPRTVADFYREVMVILDSFGVEVRINTLPSEIPHPVRFTDDTEHRSYDAEHAHRWWLATLRSSLVLQEFRGRFRGKCSPVHFFWGSFDLAVTRFSGRPAPPRPGADPITREAYSDEASSAGFWPGGGAVRFAAYYTYFAPAPTGFSEQSVRPPAAFWHRDLNELLLPYDEVRRAESPRATLLEFLQSTYEAGADLAGWDRDALERHGDEAAAPSHTLVEPPGTGGPDAAGP